MFRGSLRAHHASDPLQPRLCCSDQVYATDAEEGMPPTFEISEASDYWEVPIEGHGPPENPVPGASSSCSPQPSPTARPYPT